MGIGLYCKAFVSKRNKKTTKASLTIYLDIDPEKIVMKREPLDIVKTNDTLSFEEFDAILSKQSKDSKKRSSHGETLHYKLGIFLKKIKKSWEDWTELS